MKKWQKEYFAPISDISEMFTEKGLMKAAYGIGFADGSDGQTCANPYTNENEHRAYARGRRDGEKHYREHPDYEHDTEGGE